MGDGTIAALMFMAAGYLMGSILFGSLLPRKFKNIDIEKVSADHNPGTANVMKYAGVPMGILCLALDMMKGYLPVVWAGRVIHPARLAFGGIMAAPVAGHAFPFGRNRRGGKSIAVSFGVLLGILRFSGSVWFLAALYIFLSVVIVVNPNERRSVYAFLALGAVSLVSFLCGGFSGICVGNLLIAAVVIQRNWADACFGRKESVEGSL